MNIKTLGGAKSGRNSWRPYQYTNNKPTQSTTLSTTVGDRIHFWHKNCSTGDNINGIKRTTSTLPKNNINLMAVQDVTLHIITLDFKTITDLLDSHINNSTINQTIIPPST